MPIPDFQSLMLPILKFMGDQQEHSLNEIREHIYKTSNLSEAEKRQLLPSGHEEVLSNRIRWARWYIEKAGLLESPRRAFSRITKRGLDVLQENPPEINIKYLERFPEFVEFRTVKKRAAEKDAGELLGAPISIDSIDPMELLENAYQKMKDALTDELLNEVKKGTPESFENVVVELLTKMGYGGSRRDAGEAIGRIGDEGVDGIIKEDKLGLDTVYLQAKKWEAVVGRPEIQKFVGALKGQRANKGIFITTSTFTKEAIDYAARIESPKVVLIDGKKLASLMFEFDIGVSKEVTYEVKRIDPEFFYGG